MVEQEAPAKETFNLAQIKKEGVSVSPDGGFTWLNPGDESYDEVKQRVDEEKIAIAEAEKQDFDDAVAEDEPKAPEHGLKLYEFKVLVKTDSVEEQTASGIMLPQQYIEKLEYAINTGVIADMSPLAFTYEEWPEGVALPKIGERVVFPKFAGADVKGKDGEKYRILNDKDIHAGYIE